MIKNAFTPPDLSGTDVDKSEFFLPKNTKLHANVGQVIEKGKTHSIQGGNMYDMNSPE